MGEQLIEIVSTDRTQRTKICTNDRGQDSPIQTD